MKDVPQNRFLNKKDIAPCFLDLLDDVQNVLSLFFQNTVHGCVV